jgi:CheY-like chemotaxis protein
MSKQALVVDDDRDIRDLLSEQLQYLGFESVCAADGEKAVMILNGGRVFDVIFLDVNMPKIDGLSLVRTLRQGDFASKYAPVFMLTGNCDRNVILKAADFGATEFLLKPWSMDDLTAKVHVASPASLISYSAVQVLLTHLHVEDKTVFSAPELSAFNSNTHKSFLVNHDSKRLCILIRKGLKVAQISSLPERDAAAWINVFLKHKSKWVSCWPDSVVIEATNKKLTNKKVF